MNQEIKEIDLISVSKFSEFLTGSPNKIRKDFCPHEHERKFTALKKAVRKVINEIKNGKHD